MVLEGMREGVFCDEKGGVRILSLHCNRLRLMLEGMYMGVGQGLIGTEEVFGWRGVVSLHIIRLMLERIGK